MSESLFPVILNSSNQVNASTYEYKFPASKVFKNAKIALNSISLYYSWRNIKASYNNNVFQYTMPGYPTTTVTIPDGNYSIENLNQFLQNTMITNNHYLRDQNGNNVYYIELLTNPSLYNIQLNLFQVPNSLPTGWTNPGSFVLPGNAARATFTVLNNNFRDIIGFAAGTYTDASTLSTNTPQASPISSVLIGCSMVNNEYTNPSNLIFSFVSGSTPYGSMLHVSANDLIYADIRDGVYNSMVIKFYDQSFRELDIIDNSLIIYLVIKITK